MLYRKSLYLLALNLAKTRGLDPSSVADIHRQYGDHLYSKGDYDGAMQQFVQTIYHLQPSYVIRKVIWLRDSFFFFFHIFINALVVFKPSANSQFSNVSPRIALPWPCKLRPYDSSAQYIHQAQGRLEAR